MEKMTNTDYSYGYGSGSGVGAGNLFSAGYVTDCNGYRDGTGYGDSELLSGDGFGTYGAGYGHGKGCLSGQGYAEGVEPKDTID